MNFMPFLKKVATRIQKKIRLRLGRDISSGALPITLYADRVIEYGLIFKYLGCPEGDRRNLLDVGGGFGSPVGAIAASLGWKVTVVDILPAPYIYPGIKYIRGNFLAHDFGDACFDRILFVSSIEHFGLGGRYLSKEESNLDKTAFAHAWNLLATGGQILMTVPYGRAAVISPWHRVYGARELEAIVGHHEIHISNFFRKEDDGIWHECSEAQAADVVPNERFYAIAFVLLSKVVKERDS